MTADIRFKQKISGNVMNLFQLLMLFSLQKLKKTLKQVQGDQSLETLGYKHPVMLNLFQHRMIFSYKYQIPVITL